MMQGSDKEREEFEAWFDDWRRSTWHPLPSDIAKGKAEMPVHWNENARQDMQIAWKAARRAKLAPSDVDIAELRFKYGITSNGRGIQEFENVASFTRDALARWSAAPHPPQAAQSISAEFDGIKKAAATVELPEPDAWRYTDARGHFRYRGARQGFAVEYPILKPEAALHRAASARASSKGKYLNEFDAGKSRNKTGRRMRNLLILLLAAVMILLGVTQGPEALRTRMLRRNRAPFPYVHLKT